MYNPALLRSLTILLLSWGLLTACSKSTTCEQNPDVAKVEAPVQIERLETSFFQIKNLAEAHAFVERHPLFARQYLQRTQFPSDQVLDKALTDLATNEGLQRLGQEAVATFKNTDSLRDELHGLFQHARYYYPQLRVPAVKTFVSGLSQDVFVNDSLLVLSLDYFVGPQASYRPNVPEYINRRYTPEHLLPTIALAISSKYNQRELTNQTMLADMVQYGKALYFAEMMLPCTADSLLIGYTDQELAGVHHNEGKIWAHFIEKKLLYTTETFTVKKYIGERPNIPEIDKTAPGRIGAWVGWQIVRKYMKENPTVTLPQLMAQRDPQRILNDSHYKPKR